MIGIDVLRMNANVKYTTPSSEHQCGRLQLRKALKYHNAIHGVIAVAIHVDIGGIGVSCAIVRRVADDERARP